MKIQRLLLSLIPVIVLMTGSQELLAQQPGQAGPLFAERFSNVFDPYSRTYFSVQGTEGKQFGGQQPYASVGANHYEGSITDSVTLYSGQFMMNYNSITGLPAGTLGVQQRWLTDLPVVERSILGAGLYVDFTQSRYNNLFQQLNVNLELLTESSWVARANAYLPVGQIQQSTGLQSSAGAGPGQLSVINTVVGTGGIGHQWMDVALMGADLELGHKFFNYRTEVYGGYYNWNGPLAGFTNGVKGGVRSYLTNGLWGNVNISHDQFFGTNVYGGLTYFFGGPGGNRPNSFENLMTLPAQRSQQVAIGDYAKSYNTFKPLFDSQSGDELHMYFVKENGAGTGTQPDPSNVNSVLANTLFGHGSAMVLLDAGGNITSPIALTQDRQQIIGGGSTGTANVDFSVALGQAPGTSILHLSNLGGRPVLATPAGNAVTLTNQNTIQGFTIDGTGGATAGIVGFPQTTDNIIRDMVIQNIAGTGIMLDPAKHSMIDHIVFSNNNVDLVLSDSSGLGNSITNITSTGAKVGSINLGGSGTMTGTTLVSNATISTASATTYGILLNQVQSGATINLTNVSITGGSSADTGLVVSNSQAGSIYNLTNVDILNTGSNGISVAGAGTFSADSTSSITNTGAAAFSIGAGSMNVNYNGLISQANASSALLVTGNHTGTVTFGAGSQITTTNGDGLQFNGADGTYNILGTISMNGGDAGIDIFNSNGTFVFNNPQINNTALGMGVRIVGGGGDAPITTFHGLDITTNSNQGFFVANGGLTTVDGTANVTTSVGTAVDLSGTALAATFTNITSTASPGLGISINNATGAFGVTGTATVSGAAGSGISITNSSGLTSTLQSVAISTVGTGATDSGVNLNGAGTVSILGGTINGTTGDGIHSVDTNLTVRNLNIGGTSAIAGDGIEVVNNSGQHVIDISNNTIKGNASGVSTKDSGTAKELLLTLDGNTLQSVTGGSLALSVIGGGLNSTIIQSMNGGTVIGGTGGGIEFNRVTFDASGTALSGTQLNAGNWTIGTTGARVQGDGLRFDAPTGDLKYGTLNVANNAGTGLYVDTKTLGTTFTLGNTGGAVNTTGGAAMFLDPLTTNLTFSSVSSTNSATNGVTLNTVAGAVNLGNVSVTNATNSGVLFTNSSAAVTAGTVTVNGATTGLTFGNNTGGSFTATGLTDLSNLTGTGVALQGAVGTYNFADLNIAIAGAHTGLDFRNSNVLFNSANTTITGDGTVGGIAIDLSGSHNPNGANSAIPNIQLANAAGQTAMINNFDTGILLGNIPNGSAGANFVYGNQTPLNSGSQINVTATGVTLDTTHLTSTNSLTQGQYNFKGVSFTGLASFQKSANVIFVGSTSSGADDGSAPQNRINLAQLLALDATPSNLDGKTIVLINDNGGAGLNIGANTLTLGDNTILDSFGNGHTISAGSGVPVNVIVDTIASPIVYSDPNGAAKLTNNGSTNLVTLGNNDTIQNLILSGGTNTIFGSGVAGASINNNTIGGSSLAAISLTNTTATTAISQNSISSTGTSGILLTNAGTVNVMGGAINGTGDDGIHSSDTNLTVSGVNIGGVSTITGDGIEIVNNGAAHTVNINTSTIKATASGISTADSGVAGELVLSLDGNSLQATTAGALALSVKGGGLNSTIIKSMNGGTVIGGTGGGIEFNQVTFDASGAALSGAQVAAGNWTIGTTGARVQGDGLRFDGPSGDLKFGTLNIANNAGTGLYVDTKTLGTTFTLGSTGGTVDTTSGSALFLDPLATNLTFSTVTSANSTGNGVTFDGVSGSVNIGTLTVSNSTGNGVLVNNSTANIDITGGSITGALTDSFKVTGGSATLNYGGTITNQAGNAVNINGTTGGSTTFGGTITDNGPGTGIRLTSNAGATTFNGDVSLGATTPLSNEAVYMTNNTGHITFGNLDVTVSTLSALGAIYGLNDSLITIGGGNVTSTGAPALNIDQSKIDFTLDTITASGGPTGLTLTNLLSGSALTANTTTITGVEQKGIDLRGSQGTYSFGTLGINGAKIGIDFRNSDLTFTSDDTTITGDGSASSIAIDLSGTQNPNGANSTTPNIKLADAAGQTAIINNFNTGIKMGNVADGSAGAYFVYGNQTPLNSGSQINVINGGVTLDATHLTSTNPFTQGRYEFLGVSFTGNTSFPSAPGANYLFVGSIASGAGDGSTPNNRMSIAQLVALDATPANLDGKTVVLVNDSGAGGGASNLDLAANTLTLGDSTILDSFGNGQTFMSSGLVIPVNIAVDTIGGAVTYTDPFGNGAATLTNNGTLNVVNLGNGDTIQNVIVNGGTNTIVGAGINGLNINHMSVGGSSSDAISLTNTTGTIDISNVAVTSAGHNGIQLFNAGTVSLTDITLDGVVSNAIGNGNTNLTATNITFGGTTANGAGIEIHNTDAVNRTVTLQNLVSASTANILTQGITIDSNGTGALTVNLIGNSIASGSESLYVTESAGVAVANRLVLNLTGTNTFETAGSNSAIHVVGQNVDANNNSIVITSLGAGTITANGTGGGVEFNRVTFDSDLGTVGNQQVAAGTWNVGQGTLASQRVQGTGLFLFGDAGDVNFSTLNIYNNNGTGLSVDTKTVGTNLNLGAGAGTIDTTNGAALFLDPPPPATLTLNMTLNTVNSTNSSTNGITLDGASGSLTINGGTISGAANSDVSIVNSSATVLLSGMNLNTSGNTGVSLNGNTGPVTFTDLTMSRTAGDTAFDIDATVASTGKITINGTSSLGNTPGTAFLIGAGARDIDATALNITNDNTNSGPVVSITGQSGGTIGFGNLTNNGSTFTNVISTTGQTGGTVNFGNVSITGFGNAGTSTAVSLAGSAGSVNFADLDITTANGAGLDVGGITFSAGATPTINATGGAALTMNGATLSGGAETFDSITGAFGVNAISLTNVTGATTFTSVTIDSPSGAGVLLNNAGTVAITGGSINGTGDDGIHSSDTNLTVTGVSIGNTGTIAGDGIEIINNGLPHTVHLSNNTITADASGISTVDSGSSGELLLTFDGNTLQSLNAGSKALSVLGGGLNSTIIQSMSGGTVIGGATSGGVLFNQVTFDASGLALTGAQVAAGNWTIGTNAARVQGDGLRFDAPSGDLKFGTLNVSNNAGTGVYVDTKTLATTFTLGNTGGTVDTTGGAALFLDPLAVSLTFGSVTSDLSGSSGIVLDGVSGSFSVTGVSTVTNAGADGILINNSSATINFADVNVDTAGADGIHIAGNTGTINFNGTTTIQSTTGDGIDLSSAGGGVNFGVVGINGANADGINLSNATGSYTFGATTINGFGTNKIGVDFTGASAAASFGVTDIQNGGFGTGIDLSSTTGNKVITFQTGSNISNVALGVELSSSHTNATTANANFTFGDGAAPTGSTINATTTVNAIGLNPASGTYNFVDVTFTGTASLPSGPGGALFVSATATNGVGDGSFANPYSVSDADAITTDGATFVFLDGTYNLNTLNGGNAFTLAKNQSVEGFDNGNTVAYGTVQPANISGNLGATGGIAGRTSSLSITDSAANGIFDLAGGNSLLDITLSGSASTTYLVNANSATVGFDNTNGISLNGVTMSNAAGTATAMQFTNLNGNVSVQGNNINMGTSRLLDIDGGAATYTIARGTQPDPGSTPGVLSGGTMRVRNTTGGSVGLNGMTLSSTGTLVTLDNNDATFSFLNDTISGGVDSTLFDIDNTTGGSTTALTFGATNTITQARGTIATIGTGARDIDLSLFDFNNINTTAASVIKSTGQTGGTISFGNIGIANYNNVAGTAVSLAGSGGTVHFADLDITAANGAGLNVGGITFDGGATPTISTTNGAALVMSGTTIFGGSETFVSVTGTNGANAINMANVTGTTNFTTVNINNSTSDGIHLNNAGAVNFNGGTIDGAGLDGISSINTNLSVSGLLIGNSSAVGNNGIQVVNTTSKTVVVNNTTVTNATAAGITIDGSGGGTTTVTSFNGNTVSNAGAGGILFNGVTFDSDTGTAGIQQVTGGNTTIGSLVTTTNVTGDGLKMNSVLGDIAFGTLNIGNDNGAGLFIRDAGGKGGSFAFSNTGGTINTTNGPAMDIDPVTMNSTFASVSSTNANGQGSSSLANGINLNTVTGTVLINGGSITGAAGDSFVVTGGNGNVTYKGGITNTTSGVAAVNINGGNSGTVTFNTGTISDTAGTGLQFNNADGTYNFNGTTTLNGGNAGVDILNGSAGTFTFGTGTTITSPTGTAFNVDSSTAGVTYSGNITQANNASLVAITGETAGTITFQTGTLSATNGNGIQLSNVDSTVNFNGTTTLNGGDAGIDILAGSSGTITFETGTSITNPSGVAFNEDTSTANVTFKGSMTKNNNTSNAILVNAKSGGTTSFNGAITASTTSGNAINLTGNTGGTINFGNTSGTSNITTTSGNGFNFTGGGSLNITGNNYVVNSTTGTGFNATAGTVTATGTGNTVTSTTGRAVNINGATIGAGGVTFKSVSANGGTTSAILLSGTGSGNFTVTGDGTAAAGAQGGNASGGTIQNITGADAISLNNVGGTVSLNSMSILNITASTDATDAKQTLSGVDAIQGTGTIGGLSLVGVKISNTSDMAINGGSSTWGNLTIDNSLLEKSNRYGVSGKGDDNNEGMVQIYGISGTATITDSKFDQGARLLDLQTASSGNLNLTATNNTFSNSWKGFNSAPDSIYIIGGDAVRVQTQGSATATIILGDVNQTNAALGNTFLNDKYSLMIGHTNSTDTGLIKTTISENTFQVTNHTSPTGSPLFNYPQGTVLLKGFGTGGLDANVSHNTFDQLTDNQGLFGSLSVAAENGTTQVRINNNTFIKAWDYSMELRANNNAILTAEVNNNTYIGGAAGGAGQDDSFNAPFDRIYIHAIGSGSATMNVTMHDENLAQNQNSAVDLDFATSNTGQTLNVFLENLTAPKGYRFNAVSGSTINVYRNGSAAGTIAGILSDNNVLGGGGTATTDPPSVSLPGAGTVQGTNSAPTLPSFTVP